MKLVSLNVELNKHYDTVLNFLKREKPDVICLQEFLEIDFDRFKKELNMNGVFQAFRYVIKEPYYKDVEGKKQGIAIFARNIVNSGSIFYLGKEEDVLKSFEVYVSNGSDKKNRALLWADIKNEESVIYKFITTHLPLTEKGESTPYQLAAADSFIRSINPFSEYVVCGDMNTPRGNETFNCLAKKYKDNIPLKYKTSIDQNLHRVKGIQFMIDGLFTTPSYKASNVKLVDGVSDHMAIIANINKA